MKKFLKWILAGILTAGSIAMCVSAYGKFSDSVTVTNHISTGDINISMKELEKKNTKYVQFFVDISNQLQATQALLRSANQQILQAHISDAQETVEDITEYDPEKCICPILLSELYG